MRKGEYSRERIMIGSQAVSFFNNILLKTPQASLTVRGQNERKPLRPFFEIMSVINADSVDWVEAAHRNLSTQLTAVGNLSVAELNAENPVAGLQKKNNNDHVTEARTSGLYLLI